MPADRITSADLTQALQAHVSALAAAHITYDGHLILNTGSKTYGRAYRLNITDRLDRCQERRYRMTETGELVRWPHDLPGDFEIAYDWNHADCPRCNGSRQEVSSAHYRPPVGDDFLGMTAREAYDNLTARTQVLWDVARHAADLEDATS